MKDCTTCKYGYEDEQLGIPMCHHPKRFSEDCVDFNMHEEKESENPVPNDLEEEAEEWAENEASGKSDAEFEMAYKGFIAGAKWQKEQDLAEMAQSKSPLSVAYANRCFENGKQAMKEQMMKDALHGWLDEDNEPPYDLNVLCEEKIPFGKFKHCDKVKLIIVKED